MQGLLMLKGVYIKKIKGKFCAILWKSNKISIVIENVIWSEKNWCIKQSILAIIFSNSFTCNQGEQIKKGASNLCPNFVRNTPYWTRLISFSRSDNFLHTCLGHTQQAHDIRMTSMWRDDITLASCRAVMYCLYCRYYIYAGIPAYPSI